MSFDADDFLARMRALDGDRFGARAPGRASSASRVAPGVSTPGASGMTEQQRLAELDAVSLPGAEHVVAQAKATGRTALQAAGDILAAYKKAQGIVTPATDSASRLPSQPAPAAVAVVVTNAMRAGWAAQYRASAELQAEFTSEKAYVALKAGEAEGRVRVIAPGASSGAGGGALVTVAMRDAWRAEWRASAALQAEFSSEKTYVALREGEATGRVRVLGGARR